MNLAIQLLERLDNPKLDHNGRAQIRCALAKELEEAGNYEAARNAMGELWQRVGERPQLGGLSERVASEVLLRAGALSGWIGSARQIAGAQETAKDLINESLRIFETLSEIEKTAEALTDLAYCYWREGAYDEARVTLQSALALLADKDSEQKAVTLLRIAVVEVSATRYNDALHTLMQSSSLFEMSTSHALKGKFHMNLAICLRNLGATEHRQDYIDRALVEYAAASFHLEEAGHIHYRARVENNLGFLFFTINRFDEAHEHLDRARRLCVRLKDSGLIAQVDETRARALLAQGRNSDAERTIRAAVHILKQGGEQALLAESLTTHGVVLARLNRFEQSQKAFQAAIEIAEQVGDSEGAGRATLTFIEEFDERLTQVELRKLYMRADELLSHTQHAETLSRLRHCARRLIGADKLGVPEKTTTVFVHAAKETGALLEYVRQVAISDAAMLITGETGTGKEVLAQLVHEQSGRRGRFVAINCATLCNTLSESQLFGHVKGSFTDAVEDHPGMVREAMGGTLLLDEIADLSPHIQAKLLRLVEQREVSTVGGCAPEHIDVRIIAATNRDLKQEVACGRFRADLFYRLNAFHVHLPPLRERPEDIPVIARKLIAEISSRYSKRITFTPESIEAMCRLPLLGNARELRTLIERTLLAAVDDAVVSAEDVEMIALRQTQMTGFANQWAGFLLENEVLQYEKNFIKLALNAAQGRITHAARLLGTTHQGLAFIINGRHKDLLDTRKPARRRHHNIINHRKSGGKTKARTLTSSKT